MYNSDERVSNTHTHTQRGSCYVLGLEVPESGDDAQSLSCWELSDESPSGSCVPWGVSGVACWACSISMGPGGTGSKKSQTRIVSSCELLMIWKSSNWSRKTLPECSCRKTTTPITTHTCTCRLHVYMCG